MNEHIIAATVRAIQAVSHVRFFRTERGYQGRFYCALLSAFDERHLLDDDRRIIEMEYQKTALGMSQRPDIIYHIPVEVSGGHRWENNYAVWAFKRGASPGDARDDFGKLDEMFQVLQYPLGFFVNINADRDLLEQYEGHFADRLFGIAAWLEGTEVHHTIRHCKEVMK
jgi:hypothetical protein